MTPFSEIHARALDRHGEEALRGRMPPPPRSVAELRALGDDRYLAAMTKRVFSAGFRWQVIQSKWEGFEEAFRGFEVDHVAELDAQEIEALAQDTRIVRNRSKILATVDNARFVREIRESHGGFGAWIAGWPSDDVVGLWEALKAGGSRLGGDTGPWFLRSVGKDTFRLSRDVGQALVDNGVLPKPPGGKRATRAAQEAINRWAAESGLSLGEVSVILANSAGDIYGR